MALGLRASVINCYWLKTTVVLDTNVKHLIKNVEQRWYLLEDNLNTGHTNESEVADFPDRDLAEMTPFVSKLFPFNDSSKPIVLERRKMEKVVAIPAAICQQPKAFQQQQKIVKVWRFSPRLTISGAPRYREMCSFIHEVTPRAPTRLKTRGSVCVYYCSTYYKAVREEGGGGKWRTCATRDYEPRPM